MPSAVRAEGVGNGSVVLGWSAARDRSARARQGPILPGSRSDRRRRRPGGMQNVGSRRPDHAERRKLRIWSTNPTVAVIGDEGLAGQDQPLLARWIAAFERWAGRRSTPRRCGKRPVCVHGPASQVFRARAKRRVLSLRPAASQDPDGMQNVSCPARPARAGRGAGPTFGSGLQQRARRDAGTRGTRKHRDARRGGERPPRASGSLPGAGRSPEPVAGGARIGAVACTPVRLIDRSITREGPNRLDAADHAPAKDAEGNRRIDAARVRAARQDYDLLLMPTLASRTQPLLSADRSVTLHVGRASARIARSAPFNGGQAGSDDRARRPERGTSGRLAAGRTPARQTEDLPGCARLQARRRPAHDGRRPRWRS